MTTSVDSLSNNELAKRYTEIKNSFDLILSNSEFFQFRSYMIGFRNYFVSSEHKVIVFHGNHHGEASIEKSLLYKYFEDGYTFVCCFPKRVKEQIGFGKFMWPELDNPTTNFLPAARNNYVTIFPANETID